MIKIVDKSEFQYSILREKLLSLSEEYEIFSILDSQKWSRDIYHSYDLLGAFGASAETNETNQGFSFEQLRKFYNKNHDWTFAFLSYDLKNEIEDLTSENYDGIHAPDLYFFNPKVLFTLKDKHLEIWVHEDYQDDAEISRQIQITIEENIPQTPPKKPQGIKIKHRLSQSDYISAIGIIRQHIKRGDIYELNFCQEFYADNTEIHPMSVFNELIKKSPTPFSAYFRKQEIYIMSSSPERYLKKRGTRIISQPIKGTARRNPNKVEDAKVIAHLENDPKERAENIMIVDLVRNDLSRTAKKGSVKVDELCKVYSFEQVHQMISSVSSELNPDFDFIDVLKTTFPMGSMTGAPKIRAMQLIEQYEKTKRGIYSGAIGYITPNGDFDFNVVIRTLIYNEVQKYLSFITGGAITYLSDSKKEYEESLLKAEAIIEVLS
ncbi:MAG: aminodeoxychorismate synthase component I [Bacteroidetes bacterium]|nr:MAG: aminodeoxychorismate synthase component I [Bacteroidota bacterium]